MLKNSGIHRFQEEAYKFGFEVRVLGSLKILKKRYKQPCACIYLRIKGKARAGHLNLLYVMYTLSFKGIAMDEIVKEERAYGNPNI